MDGGCKSYPAADHSVAVRLFQVHPDMSVCGVSGRSLQQLREQFDQDVVRSKTVVILFTKIFFFDRSIRGYEEEARVGQACLAVLKKVCWAVVRIDEAKSCYHLRLRVSQQRIRDMKALREFPQDLW